MDCATCCGTGIDEAAICGDCEGLGWHCKVCANSKAPAARAADGHCVDCYAELMDACSGCDHGIGDYRCSTCTYEDHCDAQADAARDDSF